MPTKVQTIRVASTSKLAVRTNAIAKTAKLLASRNERVDRVQRMAPAGRVIKSVAS